MPISSAYHWCRINEGGRVIKMAPVDSHIIQCFGYHQPTKELYVKIVETSTLYVYEDVSPAIFSSMCLAPSVGKFFLREVRDFYQYHTHRVIEYRFMDNLPAVDLPEKKKPGAKLAPIHTFEMNRPDCWL